MDSLEQAARDLALPSLGGEADWLGRLAKVQRDLNGLKFSVMDELDGPVEGTDYRIIEGRSANRSYNTASILTRFADKDWTLKDLIDSGAARLAWQWTALRQAAERADVGLHLEHHEIDDDGDVDGAQVGEVWSSRWKVEGK